MALTDDTRIIMIHGLASKPPDEVVHELWRHALIENVRVDSRLLAGDMERNESLFRSAYWANAVPDHIEDGPAYVRKLRVAVEEAIALRRLSGEHLHIKKRGWLKAQATKFGIEIVNMLGTALTIKDDVIRERTREVELYRGDQSVGDRIRDPLERALREAWDDSSIRRVMIVSHSMGTFITYDVLWRFSYRSEPRYRKYRRRKVEHLITMGSPLGDNKLREFMLIHRWKKEGERYFPTNLESWHNYSAHGDIVCHDGRLRNDLFDPMERHVGGFPEDALRDYVHLYNPYRTTTGNWNPHKSYGYLIQPKLSYNLRWFFRI